MIPYILHVTVITTVCFLFYKLLLQKETFYRLNRWTLLSCLAVSFALPLLPIPQEWSWRDKWAVAKLASTTPERAGVKLLQETATAPVGDAAVQPGFPPTAHSLLETKQHGHRSGTMVAANQGGDQQTPAPGQTEPPIEHATAAATMNEPPIAQAKVTATMKEPTAAHSKATNAAAEKTMATAVGQQSMTAADGRPKAAAGQRMATTAGQQATNMAAVERPTMAAVSGISLSDAGNKISKTTTGTPAEKNGAGTLARFFSGAMLLLAVQWFFYLYLIGVVLFGANFLVQLAVLLYQSYSRPVIKDGRFRIVEISGNRAPCSFGNTIFINPERYDWETYNQILIHEKIHVSGRHTLDILLAEIVLVIQWFNPFAWLYRREVENNLEFLTDAYVLLDASIERSAYQLSLLRVSAPHLSFSLTNNYNQSLLKRRIVMMNSQSSSLHTVWKYFFLIPLLTGLMCALNKPAIALGAATTKLSMAHAPLFNLIAPVADTVKKPAKAADSGSAAVQKPAKAGSSASESTDEAGSDDATGYSETYSKGSDDGYGKGLGDSYGKGSSDGYGTSMTITSDNVANPQAILMAIDAQNQTFRRFGKAKSGYTVAFAPMADPVMVNAKVNAAVDAQVRGKIIIPDVLRYGFVDDTVLTEGSWYATSYGDHLSFDLKAGDEDHNWEYSLHVDKSEIDPFPGQGNVSFKLVREAGTVEFKGQFDGEEGFGHFHFVPDAGYFPALKQLGVEDIEDRRQFGFFAMNIKKDYVTMLAHNGYPHISQRDLLSLAAMHVDEAYIQYWHGVNLGDDEGDSGNAMDPRTLIRLKAMHIDRAYVDELKAAGYDHLSLRELESLKAQHIDKAYIQAMGHGWNNEPIPVRELVSYKAMHIDSAYLQGLRKVGYDNLAMRDITSLYSMHVTPEYIQQLQALGYKDLSARELCSLMAMHVTPEYIKGFRDLGYTDLSPRDLTSLKGMSVTPEMVKGYQSAGFKELTARSLSSLKAMGVTPEFMKGFVDLGYSDLTANDLASLKAMGVTPDFVAGFQKLGFDHIPARMLGQLKATGVTPEYVSKMKSQGFESKDLMKYIRLKTDFN